MLSPFRMVCRNFILPEICKPCLFLSTFQFAKFILPYHALEATTNALVEITEKLKLAQQTTEEMFITSPDDDEDLEGNE